MALIPAGYLEATFVWRRVGASRDATCSIGFDDADFNSDSPTTMSSELYTAFTSSGKPGNASDMITDWTFQGVAVTKQLEDGPLLGSTMTPITGAATGSAVPPNCAVLINKVTLSGGRRNRGRLFVPPTFPSEGAVDSAGTIASTQLGFLQTYWSSFQAAALAAGYTPVLFHNAAPYTPTDVASLLVQPLMATQRRRMRR